MFDLIATIFSADGFIPHGHCYMWQPGVLWLHVISDTLIALSYFSIPITLIYFVRQRKDLEFDWMYICFAVFILACGTTHLMEIWNVWHPTYWLSGGIKAITALASIPTAFLLIKLVPMALSLPSPSKLKNINQQLQSEIIEREKIEEHLYQKNIELKNANLAKDRFLAGMSHELRTPLNAIIGFTGTLLMKLPGPLTADQNKQLHTIQISAHHLLSLINDLLDVAKIEAGQVELVMASVVCQDVIEEVHETLHVMAQQKGLMFKIDMPADPTLASTDRRSLKQIMLNLVNNSIKFTESGSITIQVNQQCENGYVITKFKVIDTGIGIQSANQSKLFQAFMQIDSSSTRRHEGTGLGLYLCKKLSHLINGRLSFESEYGKGSTFTLELKSKRQ
ncbi:MAG TPA: ATP-binding protein [Burkholderiaceae bacterium]|jgi:signal transduction histidine kinase